MDKLMQILVATHSIAFVAGLLIGAFLVYANCP